MVFVIAMLVAAAPVKVAVPKLNAVKLDASEAALYSELLAQKLRENGFEVVTSRDIDSVLGLERQRQMLGCVNDTSCMAELAGSLGVDALLVGDIGKLDQVYVVNVKLVSAQQGKTLGQVNAQTTAAAKMPELLAAAAKTLAGQLSVSLGRPEVGASASRLSPGWALLPGVLGVGGIVTGVVFELGANARLAELKMAGVGSDPQMIYAAGKQAELLGHTFLAIGVTALLVAGALFIAWVLP